MCLRSAKFWQASALAYWPGLSVPAPRRLGDGKISMDEGYRKHRELLKRQHFGREPPASRSMF